MLYKVKTLWITIVTEHTVTLPSLWSLTLGKSYCRTFWKNTFPKGVWQIHPDENDLYYLHCTACVKPQVYWPSFVWGTPTPTKAKLSHRLVRLNTHSDSLFWKSHYYEHFLFYIIWHVLRQPLISSDCTTIRKSSDRHSAHLRWFITVNMYYCQIWHFSFSIMQYKLYGVTVQVVDEWW